jgi:hypothetical protein
MVANPQRALLDGVPALSVSMPKLGVQWPVAFAASSVLVVCGTPLIKAGLNAAAHGGEGVGLSFQPTNPRVVFPSLEITGLERIA